MKCKPLIVATVMAALLLPAAVAEACPNCKDTIATTGADPVIGGSGGLPSGFNVSIYYMLGGLFAVLGTFGYFVVRTIRTTDAARARAD